MSCGAHKRNLAVNLILMLCKCRQRNSFFLFIARRRRQKWKMKNYCKENFNEKRISHHTFTENWIKLKSATAKKKKKWSKTFLIFNLPSWKFWAEGESIRLVWGKVVIVHGFENFFIKNFHEAFDSKLKCYNYWERKVSIFQGNVLNI